MKVFLCFAALVVVAFAEKLGKRCMKEGAEKEIAEAAGIMKKCLAGKKDGRAPEIECGMKALKLVSADGTVDLDAVKSITKKLIKKESLEEVMGFIDGCVGNLEVKAFAQCIGNANYGNGKVVCDDYRHIAAMP